MNSSTAAPTSKRDAPARPLVGDSESLTTGGKDLHRRRLGEDERRSDRRRRREHARSCRRPAGGLGPPARPPPTRSRLSGLLGDAQYRSHRVRHRGRVGDRCQLENPNTVRKFVVKRAATSRQAGLADPADSGQCDQAMGSAPATPSLRPPLRGRSGSSSAGRRFPGVAIDRPQRRKIGSQSRRSNLIDRRSASATSRSRRGPDSTRSTPLSRPAVESATRICPPWPAAITRAARLSTVPK